ncbi:NACHT domain-containing protein [Streptomyces pseudovenezuelae]|uniref:NACHT domain-containing protein n=1 Tax=Streptomyces pseudovenezuelae TaxID=67350 RepID=UPI002473F920|nr:NACHT domain-containing protein [Streptomyces pseudovenezuelae]
MIALVALRKPIEGSDAALARGRASTLADQVEAGESAVWRQLLGDDTRRVNLAYALHPAEVRAATAPIAGRLTADGPGPVSLPDIVTYYRATRPLRLVVTGAAGAGKTVLALELLLALIDGRAEDDPVPVRIPLSRWDTEHQSLPELLEQRLVEAYDWPAGLAAGLVRHNLVLPVLDGLDEMDPPTPDGSPDPSAPRATAVMGALNAYQQGRNAGPLILTCRTRHYDALAQHTRVLDAARIAIAPVATDDARNYLIDRALDAPRWRPLINHLAAAPSGPLASVLSTPWRLCLAATVYHHDGNPAELLALSGPGALDRHLLARYIPAATRTAPNPRSYTPQDIHRWLHHLTTHLDPTGTLHASPLACAQATDLVLHELWPLAGRTRVRAVDALLTVFAMLTALPLTWIAPQPQAGVLAALIGGFALLTGVIKVATDRPKRLDAPFKTTQARRSLAFSIALGVTAGIVFSVAAGAAVGLPFGLALGTLLAVAAGFTQEPGMSLGARDVIRRDAAFGLAFGIAFGIAAGIMNGTLAGARFGAATGIAAGTASVIINGVAAGPENSLRYAVFLLCSRRRLPLRLGQFLDWAVTAGLMRYSGPAYQYRHRELQHWLRQHPDPPAVP